MTRNVQSHEQSFQRDTKSATLNTCQLQIDSQDRDAQLLTLNLTSEDGPANIVDLFVWGDDPAKLCQPITNLQLARCRPENQSTNNAANANATHLQSSIELSIQTGMGTFSSILPEPAGFDPEVTKYHSCVRRLCIADKDARKSLPQQKFDLPEFVLQIGMLRFEPHDSNVRHFPGPGYYAVCISVTSSKAGASLATALGDPDARSPLPSPTPSPTPSPPGPSKHSSSQLSTTNGGVWIMFDDINWDEDEDDDEYIKTRDEEMQGYVRRRDRAFDQSFGRLAGFQGMPPFDLACIMTDWKDLFRSTKSPSPDLVRMLRETAVAVCPYLMLARYEEVHG